MPTLRQRLKRPETYLFLLLAVMVLAGADSFRQPDRQVTARLYVGAVRGYQHYGRSLLAGLVACRYTPTCSMYSIQAVEKHGIRRGLILSTQRLFSCNRSVPIGTANPVP
ncbi:MAG TPA: membrane protein insertion efficiency factor YidD [Terriglobia bacterium]|nr:membrane protein insertion efficiency factor YidD [Terriglobia bacterium]